MSVMIGIDPHKGSHTAVVVDANEVVMAAVSQLRYPSQGRTYFDKKTAKGKPLQKRSEP